MDAQCTDSAFVEAPLDCANLCFKDEKQQGRFELGVSMMVYRWDALSIAVANNWGGPASAEKRDWITAIVIDLFKNEKIVDADLIEETLLYAMFDEFDTNVDDESALPIAVGIISLYKQCEALNYSTVETLYLTWQEKEKNNANEKFLPINVQEDPLNPDISDDSDDNDDNSDELDEERDVEMGENSSISQEPIVDEDGFELVQKKGKRY